MLVQPAYLRGRRRNRARFQLDRAAKWSSGFSDRLRPRSQHVLADLARRHARQLVDDDEVLRTLLTREPRALEEAADLREVYRLRGPEHHEGTPLLASLAARHRDDRHVGHRRVARQDVLDLFRTDVLARADDDVLLPSGDHQVAPVHAAPEVAHAEVAVLVEGADVVLGMHISEELLWPADEDLAFLAVGDLRAARRVDDLDLRRRDDLAIGLGPQVRLGPVADPERRRRHLGGSVGPEDEA